jgi:hypothetical protein
MWLARAGPEAGGSGSGRTGHGARVGAAVERFPTIRPSLVGGNAAIGQAKRQSRPTCGTANGGFAVSELAAHVIVAAHGFTTDVVTAATSIAAACVAIAVIRGAA